MDQIASQAIAIFRARADAARDLGPETRLADLHIESLDLALILLDIEDAFGIDFPFGPGEAADAPATVGAVIERVRSLIEAKRRRRLTAIAARLARPKSRWVVASGRA